MVNLKVIFARYGQFDHQYKIGPAEWPYFDLLYIHSGKVKIELCETQIELNSHEAILIFPNTPFEGHAISDKSLASVHHFEIKEPIKSDWLPFYEKEKGFQLYNPGNWSSIEKDLDRSLTDARWKEYDESSSMMINLILFQLWQENNKESSPLSELKKSIKANPENYSSVEDMASFQGVSESHFRRIFRQQTGDSAGKYLRNLKLQIAKEKITESTTAIKEIAEEAGYSELPHFHRAFKQYTGFTPGEYRKRFRPIG